MGGGGGGRRGVWVKGKCCTHVGKMSSASFFLFWSHMTGHACRHVLRSRGHKRARSLQNYKLKYNCTDIVEHILYCPQFNFSGSKLILSLTFFIKLYFTRVRVSLKKSDTFQPTRIAHSLCWLFVFYVCIQISCYFILSMLNMNLHGQSFCTCCIFISQNEIETIRLSESQYFRQHGKAPSDTLRTARRWNH